jgi:hypothetical protein
MFLLDANTYIQAKNQYYDMAFCPAYWECLDREFAKGNLASVIVVYNELKEGDDELADWVKARKEQFIPIDSESIQREFAKVATYVVGHENYKLVSVDQFLAGADPWIIAAAKVNGATVVTQESLVDENSKKVKIPNICEQFNVPYITTFEMLRQLNAQFGLSS